MIVIDGYRCEIVDGMRVYYGDSPCYSDESDLEDLYDVAGRQYVDDYNFDVPDGMGLMVFDKAIFDKMSAVPMTLPMDVEMGPQVDDDLDDPDLVDIRRDVRNLPDAFPAIFDKMAAVPMSLPVVVETGPQVGYESDLLLSERDIEVDATDVIRDIRLLTDVCPMMFEESATVPLSLPVVVDTETQWWSPSVMDVAVLRDGSILNLTAV